MNKEEIIKEFREKFGKYEEIVAKYGFDSDEVGRAIENFWLSKLQAQKQEILLDQLYRLEGVLGKYNCQHGGTKCNFQTNCHRLIRKEIEKLTPLTNNQ